MMTAQVWANALEDQLERGTLDIQGHNKAMLGFWSRLQDESEPGSKAHEEATMALAESDQLANPGDVVEIDPEDDYT